jgi:predicted acyl esterase
MGINKWRFESEWPLARTEWTKLYLLPVIPASGPGR